jgi:hypothetical protein
MQHFYVRISLFLSLFVSWGSPIKAGVFEQPPPVLPNPSACQLGLAINDFSCNASHLFHIDVQNAPGTALGSDVYLKEIRLIVKHEWVADLDMTLISPSGVAVMLSSDNGSGNDNYGNPSNGLCDQFTSFISNSSPEACNAVDITMGQAPFIGPYLPEENLSSFNDGTAPNGIWTLQLCDDGKEHYGSLEFVELVFEAVACITPSVVVVEGADSTAAMLNWSDGGNCNTSIIEFGPPGFSPGIDSAQGGGIVVFVGCPPVVLNGLSPLTDYEVYIREYCGNGEFSANSCPVAFSTGCSPPPPTLVEDFNGQALCSNNCPDPCQINGVWTNATNDDFDWIINAGPTLTSLTGPNDDLPGGGNYIYLESSPSPCRSNNEAVLVSNCILVQANPDSCDMSFNYMMYGVNVSGVSLQISTNGGLNWQSLWSANGNQGNLWKKQFIDLDAFHGQTAQFRFVGTGGNGNRGDLALDNIVFYGSQDLGFPNFVYYLDEDQDGYGRADVFVAACQPIVLLGFVPNDDDCDDSDFFVNPGMEEIPCDGFDSNCNGDIDEFSLPLLQVLNDTVCSGAQGQVSALPFAGQVYWYDAPLGGNLLHEGSTYAPPTPLVNNTDDPIVLTFYAEEISLGNDTCLTLERSPASITILPQPALTSIPSPEVCEGILFDLNTLDIVDVNGVNGQISFHQSLPPDSSNQISAIIIPEQNTHYYIVSTSNGGCRDIADLVFNLKPSPKALIAGDTTLCYGSSQSLIAIDTGNGIGPLAFEWYNGSANPIQQVNYNPIKGASDIYSVTITGANACSSTDSIRVKTVVSVDSVLTTIQAVSNCNGSDGAITISPLNGQAPFTYEWGDNLIANQPGPLTINNLQQGTYSFVISDASTEGCDFFLPVVVINGPSAVVNIEQVSPVSCSGGTDGCIELEVIGNSPSILWNTGATTEKICGLAAGDYTVTVTEGNCANVLMIHVPEPEHLKVFPTVEEVSCTGLQDGKITLNVFGGSPPYQFLWNNGQMTKTIGNLPAGNYSVTVSDTRGCQLVLQNITIKAPAPISILPNVAQPQCFGLHNGGIEIAVNGGTSPYTINWSNGAVGTAINNLSAQSYQVSITDSQGCGHSESIVVGQPSALGIAVDFTNEPSCNGLNNGSLGITAFGGNGGYTYDWGQGLSTEDLANIGQGAYLVTITDQSGCTFVSDSIFLTGPDVFDVDANVQSPPCVGLNNGFIEISVNSGGQAPYQYYWSTDFSECCLYGLSAGEYTVTVIDGNGCMFDSTFLLTTQQPISVLDLDTISPACHGTATGEISIVLTGGVEPYNIAWSNGKQGNTITELVAANYAATVTAANNCVFYTGLIPLSQPPALSIKVENAEDIACFGGADGSIDVSLIGGVGPYQVQWSNGASSEDLGGIGEGVYTLTIQDANHCVVVSEPIEIGMPDPLTPFSTLVVPPGCEIVNDVDTICVGANGGLAPYFFVWDTGDTSTCLINPQVGDYHVTVTDAAGCTQELMSVKVPEAFFPVAVEVMETGEEISCAGAATGSMSVVVEGGLAPFNYIWSNGESGFFNGDTLTNSALGSGEYNVTITDNTGCVVVSEWASVLSNPLLLLSVPSGQLQHVKCKDNQDGAINLNITGGQAPFDITWTDENGNTISNNEDIQNLSAGTYAVFVADANGCTRSISIDVSEPEAALSLLNPPPTLSQVSCFGFADGSIDLTVIGGTFPYSYHWSNSDTTQDLTNLPPGQYAVTVTDANTCAIQSIFYTISQPAGALALQNPIVSNVECFGDETGIISINPSGGTPGYTYNWLSSNNEIFFTEDLENVAAGTYYLTVFDANNCHFDTTFAIEAPDSLYLTATATAADPGQSNGIATAMGNGGTPPYSYIWSNGQTGPSADGLAAGWHQVTVTDAAFCETSIYVQVQTVSASQETSRTVSYAVYPNPSTGATYLHLEASIPLDFEFAVYNAYGAEVLAGKKAHWSKGTLRLDLSGMPSGFYQLAGMVNGQRIFTEKIVLL